MTINEKRVSSPETPFLGSYSLDDVNLSLTFPNQNPKEFDRASISNAEMRLTYFVPRQSKNPQKSTGGVFPMANNDLQIRRNP